MPRRVSRDHTPVTDRIVGLQSRGLMERYPIPMQRLVRPFPLVMILELAAPHKEMLG